MAVNSRLLEEYRKAAESLLDAIIVFEARIHTRDAAEYKRLELLVVKRHEELDSVRREFERKEDMRQAG